MLWVDQCSITIMMAILILLMKLHSKYMENSNDELFPAIHKQDIFMKNKEASFKENWVFPL